MLRVSESTSSFSEFTLLNPRALTAQVLEVCWPTWMPGTRRSASGMVLAPERRMSPRVITATAAAASRSGFLGARHRRDFDVHELFEAHLFEGVERAGFGVVSDGGQRKDRGPADHAAERKPEKLSWRHWQRLPAR